MDIQLLQKVNSLAKDLKEKGVCSNMEEAYSEAERMLNKDRAPEKPSVDKSGSTADSSRVEVSEINDQKKLKEDNASDNGTSSSNGLGVSYLDFRKMQERVTKVEEQISTVFNKLNEMISEINKLQSAPAAVTGSSPAPKKAKQATITESAQKDASHPRSGTYTSNDVSIEKMFYFGSGN